MNATPLLIWMSARREGSWQQFRSAVEELHIGDNAGVIVPNSGEEPTDQLALPFYQTIRLNIQRMGHAEFYSNEESLEWRVTPPSIAIVRQANGWRGVVAGARSRQLIRILSDVAGPKLQSTPIDNYPDQLRITDYNLCDLHNIAKSARFHIQDNAPESILRCLPPIDEASIWQRAELPIGSKWLVEKFMITPGRWLFSNREEARRTSFGMFRFTHGHRHKVLLCFRGAAFRVPIQIGKFFMLQWIGRRIIRYDVQKQRLSFPLVFRPPYLVERAIILCSGMPPIYDSSEEPGYLHYPEVPEAIADRVFAVLRQGVSHYE